MSLNNDTLFEAFLNQHDDAAWGEVIQALLPSIHEVDKTAVQIWFRFFPVALLRALEAAGDPEQLAKELQLSGNYYLKEQIDTSHRFLYGHRYWPEVRKALIEYATSVHPPQSLELAAQIRELAAGVARQVKADPSLLTGITAVAFMTLEHVGIEAFKASKGLVSKVYKRSPDEVLKARAKDDSQGLLGFLRGDRTEYSITFDEHEQASFKLINTQELTTAAANDKRDYTSRDPRCVQGEGPIPIECRSAACGTCWVGVLGGAEKLSNVAALESRQIKEFGYIDTDQPKPLIRLACMAQATGAVSIVIPPWNGVFGKYLRAQKIPKTEASKASSL